MKSALTFAGIGETFAGLALLIMPSLVSQLLLGEQLASAGVPMARIAGMANTQFGADTRSPPKRFAIGP